MKRKLITLLLLVAFLGGCSRVQMSPEYRQVTEMSALNVAELNRRCQDGNVEACKEGLFQASETLNLLVDALYGRSD